MDISLELSPEGKMIAKGAAGYPVFVNRIDPLHPEGTGPMELVLEGLAGCASIDVLIILEKQRGCPRGQVRRRCRSAFQSYNDAFFHRD